MTPLNCLEFDILVDFSAIVLRSVIYRRSPISYVYCSCENWYYQTDFFLVLGIEKTLIQTYMNSIYHVGVNMNLVKRFGGQFTTRRATAFMHEINNL